MRDQKLRNLKFWTKVWMADLLTFTRTWLLLSLLCSWRCAVGWAIGSLLLGENTLSQIASPWGIMEAETRVLMTMEVVSILQIHSILWGGLARLFLIVSVDGWMACMHVWILMLIAILHFHGVLHLITAIGHSCHRSFWLIKRVRAVAMVSYKVGSRGPAGVPGVSEVLSAVSSWCLLRWSRMLIRMPM